jgi:signal transduction histidine kinase
MGSPLLEIGQEEALRKADGPPESVLDSLTAEIAVLDETGAIVAINRAWREFARANPPLRTNVSEGANYLTVCDATTGSEAEEAAAMAAGIRAVQRCEQQEFVLEYPCHSPREQRWFNARVTRFLDHGAPRIVVTHENITARHQAEEELKRTLAELARSNEELQRFADVASHDLQEPLRMVSSYTQLLARRYKGRLDADADEFIAYAVDGANRMQELITDLLEYSRVGTRGKSFAPVDSAAVLGQALTNLKAAIEESGAVVTHDPLPTLLADKTQLTQLFQNLVGNAIKFRGQEPPRIHVSAEQQGNAWVFSVRDHGIGIDPQYSERIFAIFQRLHTREEYPGTGIGLAVCRKIVERHHGRIWVESQPGQGSTFFFTLAIGESAP